MIRPAVLLNGVVEDRPAERPAVLERPPVGCPNGAGYHSLPQTNHRWAADMVRHLDPAGQPPYALKSDRTRRDEQRTHPADSAAPPDDDGSRP